MLKRLQKALTQTQHLLEQYDVQQHLRDNQHAWLLPLARPLFTNTDAELPRSGEIATVEITHYLPIAAPDQLLLWQVKPKATGLVALAEVVGEVIERASPLLTQRIWVIHYRYAVLLPTPIAKFSQPELQHLSRLAAQKQPVRLDISAWNALYSHLFDEGEVDAGNAPSESSPVTAAPSGSDVHTADGVEDVSASYAPAPPSLTLDAIASGLAARQLHINPQDLRRYHLALQVRGFVVLSGISGVGKTWLAESYADLIGAQWLTVPVIPNWTSSEDLLGFFNPISNSFQTTPFTEFMRAAARVYQRQPAAASAFHVILDEMNLARVEHYFAPLLSALEQRQRYGHAVLTLAAQQTLRLTPNLYFIGTVNRDETTHEFADKVFDRAQVVELHVTEAQLAAHLGDLPYAELVLAIWTAVQPVAPFGFRVVDEIRTYVTAAADLEVSWQAAVDEQVVQKIVPKLRGMHMEPVLKHLLVIAEQYELALTAAQVRRLQADMEGLLRY